MTDQADRREAGSREFSSPATEGGPNPSDQPVTGSASPSDLYDLAWHAARNAHGAWEHNVSFETCEVQVCIDARKTLDAAVASQPDAQLSKSAEIDSEPALSINSYQQKLAEAIFDDGIDSLAEFAPDAAKMFRTCMRDEKIAHIAAVLASEGVVDPEQVDALREAVWRSRAEVVRLEAEGELQSAEVKRLLGCLNNMDERRAEWARKGARLAKELAEMIGAAAIRDKEGA